MAPYYIDSPVPFVATNCTSIRVQLMFRSAIRRLKALLVERSHLIFGRQIGKRQNG